MAADSSLDRLLASLSASFDAAVRRQEDEAANDLAQALRHDRTLIQEVARRGGRLRIEDAEWTAIGEVGEDYFGAGTPVRILIPQRHAVVASDVNAPTPVSTGCTFIERLRAEARREAGLHVWADGGVFAGSLTAVGRDYVALETATNEVLIAADVVRLVRVSPED